MPPTLPVKPFPFGGIVAAAAQNITSISNASGAPVVLTVTGHGFPVGATIYVRTSGITGQVALNANWVAKVVDANTILLLTLAGWSNTNQILGNGVASASGTIVRTPLSITANYSQFGGLGIEAHSVTICVPPGNVGNVYVGIIIPPSATFAGIFMGITTPYVGVIKIFANNDQSVYNVPHLNYMGANSLSLDAIFIDYGTIGDVALVSAFQI
jgi:hypothetical protein